MFVSLIKRLGAAATSARRRVPAGLGTSLRTPLTTIASNVKLSLNDPRWGNKPDDERKAQENRRPNNQNNNNDGPPDLDQLWRDFNQRLNRMFGNKRNGGGGGDGFRPDARGVGLTATVVGAIAALIWLASGAFVVQEGQVGIVTTFGKLSHTAGPGFNWRWPAPFQAHETVNVAQVQTAEIGYRANVRDRQPAEALMLTGDQNIVDVRFSVQYKVTNPVAWVFNNRDQVETVRDAAETVVRELVGKAKLDDILNESRDQLALDARRAIQQMANGYGLGAEITGVTVQSVQPPEQVAAAFEEVGKARDEGTRLRAEAQAYADDILPQAKARAARLVGRRRSLPRPGREHRDRQRRPLRQGRGRIRQGAGRHARPHVHGHDAAGVLEHQQDLHRYQDRHQPAVPAARPHADPVDRQRSRDRQPFRSGDGAAAAAAGSKPAGDGPAERGPVAVRHAAAGRTAAAAAAQQQPAQPVPHSANTAPAQPQHRDLRSREHSRERESR
jgi:membrane protease subunit HflK